MIRMKGQEQWYRAEVVLASENQLSLLLALDHLLPGLSGLMFSRRLGQPVVALSRIDGNYKDSLNHAVFEVRAISA